MISRTAAVFSSIRAFAIRHSWAMAIACLESTERNGLLRVERQMLQSRLAPLKIILGALEKHIASLDAATGEGL